MKGLSYILFIDSQGSTCVGFNKYNKHGFIDDGHKWSGKDYEKFNDFFENIDSTVFPLEIGAFTYEVKDVVELQKCLKQLNIPQMKAGG